MIRISNNNKCKVVILAGGLGTRLREETEFKPKPMVEIGSVPIIFHIMKNFIEIGFDEFIIAAGYKGNVIKNFFSNLEINLHNIKIEGFDNDKKIFTVNDLSDKRSMLKNLKVTVIDTGNETPTGGRINKLKPYLNSEKFICTYGDGLSNVNPSNLINFHNAHKKIASVTAVKVRNRFGLLELNENNEVIDFKEKPIMNDWVNGGFFVFEPEIFDYLNDNITLEQNVIEELVKNNQISAFKHNGFWFAMDTYREFLELNKMWDEGNRPWVLS